MALAIRYERLDDLVPYEKNPRTHSPAQLKAIERSLTRYGWTTPMGKADGVLIYGHARRLAAMALRERKIAIPQNEDPDRGPVVDLSYLSAEDRRAYIIADNQLALLAGWDEDLLRLEVQELSAMGYDLTLTGFTVPEITDMLAVERVGDEAPGSLLELAEVTIGEPRHTVAAGDHWTLSGRHHLFCVSVIEGWPVWAPYLKRGMLFVPYPGPFVPYGRKAVECGLVMVQPDSYAAGHLLDRYAETMGEGALGKGSGETAKAA
jgi:hypothetical protein